MKMNQQVNTQHISPQNENHAPCLWPTTELGMLKEHSLCSTCISLTPSCNILASHQLVLVISLCIACSTEEPWDKVLLTANKYPLSSPSCPTCQTAELQGWPGEEMHVSEDDRGGDGETKANDAAICAEVKNEAIKPLHKLLLHIHSAAQSRE